ncbi:DNA-(apurinic or apyrimidinic site) lyase-like isoform X4 [Thraustotheca clavata]|uniref:DNA-(Apurinic or apyrimidinic site) lyase-like isoform X4 n=1 Tax=Thraustotheca clavata TaxID=74557 RepID=A0A1V9ZZF5_9STRA|nr:DNA-(apurinic or apyrimidinic site) lyase-like isoform X4 [Thraustotheca clavata]
MQKKLDEKTRLHQTYMNLLMERREMTIKSGKVVGAHVSAANGVENAIFNAAKIGARAFAFFPRAHRTWKCKPLEEKTIDAFKKAMNDFGYTSNDIVPHGSYLINCGSPEPEMLEKSRGALLDEVKRCELLGLSMYNFHPGATKKQISVEKCMDLIAESIVMTLDKTNGVTLVLENMSCQGSTIGGKFSELKGIIERVPISYHDRIGVCFDTCHAFAAGLDIKNAYEASMKELENNIGLDYLKAIHLNDSKGDLNCHLDRHENIGKGKIGLSTFELIMNDTRLNNIPMILETPVKVNDDSTYEKEISLLYSLSKTSSN